MYGDSSRQEDFEKFVGFGIDLGHNEVAKEHVNLCESTDSVGDIFSAMKKGLNGGRDLFERSGVKTDSAVVLNEMISSKKIKVRKNKLNEAEKIKTVEDTGDMEFLGSSGKEKYYLEMNKDDDGYVTDYRVADAVGVVVAEEKFEPTGEEDEEGKAPTDVLVDLINKLRLDEVGVQALEEADVFAMTANDLVDGARGEDEKEEGQEIEDADTGESNADGEEFDSIEDLADDSGVDKDVEAEGGEGEETGEVPAEEPAEEIEDDDGEGRIFKKEKADKPNESLDRDQGEDELDESNKMDEGKEELYADVINGKFDMTFDDVVEQCQDNPTGNPEDKMIYDKNERGYNLYDIAEKAGLEVVGDQEDGYYVSKNDSAMNEGRGDELKKYDGYRFIYTGADTSDPSVKIYKIKVGGDKKSIAAESEERALEIAKSVFKNAPEGAFELVGVVNEAQSCETNPDGVSIPVTECNESKKTKVSEAIRRLREAKEAKNSQGKATVKDENPNKGKKEIKGASVPAATDKSVPAKKDDNKGKKNMPTGVSTPKATDKGMSTHKDENPNKGKMPTGEKVPAEKKDKVSGGTTTKTAVSGFRGKNDGFETGEDFVSFVKRMSESVKKGK